MLHVHRADRADSLADALGGIVADPLPDPLATEVVAVPTRGVERWLAQRLSGHLGASPQRADGVCANVDFPFPARLVGTTVAAAAGIDGDHDPWLPERAVWPLLDVVDECLTEPWMAPLAAHLGAAHGGPERPGAGQKPARRFESVRHIADLYDRYGVHRPEMLCGWAAGADDVGAGDGRHAPLPDVARWQPELWRRLRARIGLPSPAERLAAACDRLRSDPTVADLPDRVSLFGLTRLPFSHLQVLSALATEREVHLFLLHPSPALWAKVDHERERRPQLIVRRAADPTAALAENPLLASWAQDARELHLVVAAIPGPAQVEHHPPLSSVHSDTAGGSLLALVQAGVRADYAPPGPPLPGRLDDRPYLDPLDRSLEVHACHGAARQVEVVRDTILQLLADDPTLEARDVIVMCPDIETFAPLIHATFSAGDRDDAEPNPQDPVLASGNGQHHHISDARTDGGTGMPDLRVRLADRSLRQTNPVLGVVGELLDLASARVTAAQVLDLAGREPVRRRFELDDDDLARLVDWVAATGVRWGLDAGHRAPFHLEWLDANTWSAGLDRVLLGAAMAEDGQPLVGGVLPLDDVGSADIDLAGRLAELVDRLQAVLDDLNGVKPISAWIDTIAAASDALTLTAPRDAWQRLQLENLLDDVLAEAAYGAALLNLAEIRALLADRLRGRPTRANFRTGHLTVCTLVPMRSVPHRVVCLLGLDDGVFPRQTARDGDDLILDDPHVGDRDGRAEDRQLLLDALLAATDRLIITYCGRDERTNAKRPPAVPVGELLELIDRSVRTADSALARHQVLVNHPLQPFDVRNFVPGALAPGGSWSFDAVALRGARALAGDRIPARPFLERPLPAVTSDLIEVDQLVRFAQHPVKAFLRQRLGMSLGDYHDELGASVPIELDFLEQWDIGQRLVEARIAGADLGASIDAEMARGLLPPGALSQPILDRVARMVDEVVGAALSLALVGESGSAEVHVALPDGRALLGTVPGVAGNVIRSVSYSRLGPKHRLAAWVRYLALTATDPDRRFETVTIGRRRANGAPKYRVSVACLTPLADDLALGHLGALVDLYDRGLREPLPLYCNASAAWVEARAAGRDPDPAAAKAWESDWDRDREDKELEHQLVLGGRRSLAEILAAGPRPDETGAGWPDDESTRFGRYAARLWDGLLSCEELTDR